LLLLVAILSALGLIVEHRVCLFRRWPLVLLVLSSGYIPVALISLTIKGYTPPAAWWLLLPLSLAEIAFAVSALRARKPDGDPPKNRATEPALDHVVNRLSQESDALLRDLKILEESFGRDALILTVCRGYVERRLSNNKVLRYLEKQHGESLNALQLWLDSRRLGA
jgi:hypothetical protein